MKEQFKENQWYQKGAPILITGFYQKSERDKDQQIKTKKVSAEFTNILSSSIEALELKVVCLDTFNTALSEVVFFYHDIDKLDSGIIFGKDIFFEVSKNAFYYKAYVTKYKTNGQIVTVEKSELVPYNKEYETPTLETYKAYYIKKELEAEGELVRDLYNDGNLIHCFCGETNHIGNDVCYNCGITFEEDMVVDDDFIHAFMKKESETLLSKLQTKPDQYQINLKTIKEDELDALIKILTQDLVLIRESEYETILNYIKEYLDQDLQKSIPTYLDILYQYKKKIQNDKEIEKKALIEKAKKELVNKKKEYFSKLYSISLDEMLQMLDNIDPKYIEDHYIYVSIFEFMREYKFNSLDSMKRIINEQGILDYEMLKIFTEKFRNIIKYYDPKDENNNYNWNHIKEIFHFLKFKTRKLKTRLFLRKYLLKSIILITSIFIVSLVSIDSINIYIQRQQQREQELLQQKNMDYGTPIKIESTEEERLILTSTGKVIFSRSLSNNDVNLENNLYDITNNFYLSDGENIVSISSGKSHYSALSSNGRLWMWGNNSSGQIHTSAYSYVSSPLLIDLAIDDEDSITSVSLGKEHSAALTSKGELFVWGANDYYQCGASGGFKTSPGEIFYESGRWPLRWNESIASVSLGDYHSAILTSEGRAYIWGQNNFGQIGDGTTTLRHSWVEIDVGEKINSIALGEAHTIMLTVDNQVYTWGSNIYGQLGLGKIEIPNFITGLPMKRTPQNITEYFSLFNNDKITSIYSGPNHLAAISSQSNLFMWGRNSSRQIEFSVSSLIYYPKRISTLDNLIFREFSSISLGDYNSSIILSDINMDGTENDIYVWGRTIESDLGSFFPLPENITKNILPWKKED